jgi:dienelactone hydrolase
MQTIRRSPITLTSEGQQIVGIIHRTDGDKPRPGVVIYHGFLASKDTPHRMFVEAADALAQAGFIVLRADLRGRGDSDGASIDITPQADLNDSRAILNALATIPGVDGRLAVIGMSWGGLMASCLAGEDARVKAAVLWSSLPTTSLNWQPEFQTIDGREAAENWGQWVGRQFYDALPAFHPLDTFKNVRCPVLAVYGTADESVLPGEIAQFEDVVKAAGVPYEISPVEGGDHIFMNTAQKRLVIEHTVGWLVGVFH